MEQYISALIISFFIYGFVGWIWESFICPLMTGHRIKNSGFLNGPIVPIYGVGAIVVVVLFSPLESYLSLFLEGAVVACMIEYLTSWGMEKLYHRRWWDYSDKAFHMNGRVCLEGFLVFGLFSVVTVKWIQPFLMKHILHYDVVLLIVIASVLSTLFTIDFITTVTYLTHLDEHIEEIKLELIKIIDELEESTKNWNIILEKNKDSYHELLKHTQYIERRIMKAFPQIMNKKKK